MWCCLPDEFAMIQIHAHQWCLEQLLIKPGDGQCGVKCCWMIDTLLISQRISQWLFTAEIVAGDPITWWSLDGDWTTGAGSLPQGANGTLHPPASRTYLSSLNRKCEQRGQRLGAEPVTAEPMIQSDIKVKTHNTRKHFASSRLWSPVVISQVWEID